MARFYQSLALLLTGCRVFSEGLHILFDDSTILIIATLALMPPDSPPGFKRLPSRPRRPRK